MIPFILAVAGGYLLGDSFGTDKFAYGGMMADGGETGKWFKEGSDKWGLERSETYIKENDGKYDLYIRTYDDNKWGYKKLKSFDTLEEAKINGYEYEKATSVENWVEYADGGMMADGGLSDQLDVVRKQRDLAEYYEKNEKNYKNNYGHRIITAEELAKVKKKVDGFLNPLGYSATIEKSIGDVLYVIEPSTRKVGNNRSDFFDGMQILALEDGTFEVSEYQAGKNENELYIYKITNSLITALKDLIKGNKREPIKKYANGGKLTDSLAKKMDANFNYELKVQEDYPYKNIANLWLEDNSKDSIKYKLAILLLREKKNPDEILGIDDPNRYARLLRSLEKAKGESKHEMSFRTENYTLGEAEKWARESLSDIFYVHGEKMADGGMMADGGEVDEELIRASAKSIYDHFGGMMELRNKFLQLANTDEKYGDIETANLRRKIVKEYQDKQPKMMADGGMMAKGGGVKGTYTGKIVNAEIGEVMVGKISGYRGNGEPVYDVHSFGSLRKDIREKKGELSNSKIKELLNKMADGGMMADGGSVRGGKFNIGDKVMVNDSGYVKYFTEYDLSKPATIISKNKIKSKRAGKSFTVYSYGIELADGKKPFNNAPEQILVLANN